MSLNNTNNSCNAVCGDGVLATIEQCDTAGVTANGCSATCTIEPSFFCTGTVGSASVCQSCIANCLNCTNAIDCQLCDSLYDFNISNSSCDPNCSLVTDCVSCTVVSNAISCQTCILGYEVNASNACATVCGDGIIAGTETCDDNGTVDGDGCSSTCTI